MTQWPRLIEFTRNTSATDALNAGRCDIRIERCGGNALIPVVLMLAVVCERVFHGELRGCAGLGKHSPRTRSRSGTILAEAAMPKRSGS